MRNGNKEISDLINDVNLLNTKNDNLDADNKILETDISSLKSKITKSETELSDYKSLVLSQQSEINNQYYVYLKLIVSKTSFKSPYDNYIDYVYYNLFFDILKIFLNKEDETRNILSKERVLKTINENLKILHKKINNHYDNESLINDTVNIFDGLYISGIINEKKVLINNSEMTRFYITDLGEEILKLTTDNNYVLRA